MRTVRVGFLTLSALLAAACGGGGGDTPANQPPVLAAIGAKSVNEGAALTFTVTATDPENSALTYTAAPLPAGAAFNGATRTFTWTPGFTQAGTYTVTFTVSDGPATDSEAVTITVANVNRAPVLTAIGDQTVGEDSVLGFQLEATDPDGDAVTFSATGLPTGATLSAAGAFSWTPGFAAAGSYAVTFSASDGTASATETVTITVTNVNRPPVLAAIGAQSGVEGAPLTFTVTATDPDGDALTLGATFLPTGASFDAATGVFTWTPGNADAGTYEVIFSAADGTATVNENVAITIADGNVAPVLATIGPKVVAEDALLTFTVSATDANGDALTYGAANLPTGAAFDAATRTFTWTPNNTQAGTYNVTFSVSDGVFSDSEVVVITVSNVVVNEPPVLAAIGNKTVAEGASLAFIVSATDPNGGSPTLTVTGLPAGAAFDPGGGFLWQPGFTAAGTFTLTFTATDAGGLTDSETITITVTNTNRLPVFTPVAARTVAEGVALSFTVSATDADGETLTYAATNVPAGATFSPATRTFDWTPGFAQAGQYTVNFTATDTASPAGVGTLAVVINVTDVNRSPVLAAIGPQSGAEGALLAFTLSATDPDGDTLAYSAAGLPNGATLNATSGAFAWTPAFNEAGTYAVTFTATDPGGLADSETVQITITNVNQAPVLASILSPQAAAEGSLLAFTATATDPDGDALTFSLVGAPTGAAITAGGAFTWTPTNAQAGSYTFEVSVTDGTLSDSQLVDVIVADVNGPPVVSFSPAAPYTVAENALITITVSAVDPDGDLVSFSGGALPTGATFDPATGVLSWTPTFDQAGTYTIDFTATDSINPPVPASVTITVTNVNRAPVLAAIGPKTVEATQPLAFTVTATDPDADALTFSATGLPAGATLDAATGAFSWTPPSATTAQITFTVSDGDLTDSEVVTVTVTPFNAPPVFAATAAQTVQASRLLSFSVSASDPEGGTVTYSATGLPAGSTFDTATGAFSWTAALVDVNGDPPPYTVTITFSATDGNRSSSQQVAVNVIVPVPLAPVASATNGIMSFPQFIPGTDSPFTWVDQPNLWDIIPTFEVLSGSIISQVGGAMALRVGLDDFPNQGGGVGDPTHSELTFLTPEATFADGLKLVAVDDGTQTTDGGRLLFGPAASLNCGSDVRLTQQIALPATPATLSWYDDFSLQTFFDRGLPGQTDVPFFRVTVRDLAGALLVQNERGLDNGAGSTGGGTIDLSAFAGQTVVIGFESRNAGFCTATLVDNVSVLAGAQQLVVNGTFSAGLTGWTVNDPREPRNVRSPVRILSGLDVQRSFYAPPTKSWARWVDTFHNPNAAGVIAIPVRYTAALGSDGFGVIYDPFTNADPVSNQAQSFVTYDASPAGPDSAPPGPPLPSDRDMGFVFGTVPQGTTLTVTPYHGGVPAANANQVTWIHNITVPAGATVTVVQFMIMVGDDTGALTTFPFTVGVDDKLDARAADLAVHDILGNVLLDPQYLDGMTAQQIATIVNL